MTPSIFAIQVVSNNTLIQTFSISYLAVWNESNIYVSQHNVTNVPIILCRLRILVQAQETDIIKFG